LRWLTSISVVVACRPVQAGRHFVSGGHSVYLPLDCIPYPLAVWLLVARLLSFRPGGAVVMSFQTTWLGQSCGFGSITGCNVQLSTLYKRLYICQEIQHIFHI